jgi:hypothetical protein
MPAARLSDSQKAELVDRFRAGEGLQPLAEAYGCSANTVSRVVKAAMPPADYERLRDARLKEQRSRRSGAATPEPSPQLDLLAEGSTDVVELEESPRSAVAQENEAAPESEAAAESEVAAENTLPDPPVRPAPPVRIGSSTRSRSPVRQLPPVSAAPAQDPGELAPTELAIADADDFGDDESDEDPADSDDLQDDPEASDALAFVPLPLLEVVDDHTEIRARPLQAADLSGSAWMLVDKAVELQARPLSEFPELGRLPAEEQERQALLVFVNPRQAKRQCGRSQRVIKIPDSAVLARTAPYLLAQGISRLVIEGALFALPGS